LEQIILKCLALLTILQLSQIFLTDALIFIKNSNVLSQQHKTTQEKQGKNPYFSTL
jgi:hypothetical protein